MYEKTKQNNMRKLKIKTTDIVQLFNVVQENAAVVNCPFFDKEIEVELECRKCYLFNGIEQEHVLCKCPEHLEKVGQLAQKPVEVCGYCNNDATPINQNQGKLNPKEWFEQIYAQHKVKSSTNLFVDTVVVEIIEMYVKYLNETK